MGTPKKTYPIVKTDGETIYLMGREFQEGTDEYFTERDRIQANYRKFEEENADLIEPGGPLGTDTKDVEQELRTNYTIGDLS